MLPQDVISVFSDCHSTLNVPEELEKLWTERGVDVGDLHHAETAFFAKYQQGTVAEIYSFFAGSRSVAANDELLDALAAAADDGTALLAAEEARYLFVRNSDPETTLIERPTEDPAFDIWSARYDIDELEHALTGRRIAIGRFDGGTYLFNEDGDVLEAPEAAGQDTLTYFGALDALPEDQAAFVGEAVSQVLANNGSAYRA